MRIKPSDKITDLEQRDLLAAKGVQELLDDQEDDWHLYVAREFYRSESTDRNFHIGVPSFDTRHVLYMLYMAAKYLCCGIGGYDNTLKILEQAVTELKAEILQRRAQERA
jgi:hypothetical protein